MRRNEKPLRRVNPSGKVVWVARWTGRDGKRRSGGTFERCGPCRNHADDGTCCADHRIGWCYEQDKDEPVVEDVPITVREYYEGIPRQRKAWLTRHPRAERTEANYDSSVRAVLDAETEDGLFGDLAMGAVRARHLDDLVDVMLREHERAASGTRKVIAVLSAMFMDAIRDEVAEMNPALLVTVRDNDPRVQKARRDPVLLSWEEMRAFAMAAGGREPMIRTLGDCGLRLGELLALECKHVKGDVLIVEQHAWRGQIYPGTKQGDRREVPIPPVLGSLLALARRDRIGFLFPAPHGGVWSERTFYDAVWKPTRKASGMDVNPHDFRHSFVSLMRAAGVDPADLAKVAGHSVETATAKYTHSTGATFELMRRVAG